MSEREVAARVPRRELGRAQQGDPEAEAEVAAALATIIRERCS